MISMQKISNRIKKNIRKLYKKKYRKKKKQIVIEGINPIIRAIENNLELKYLLINETSLELLKELSIEDYDKIYTCDYNGLKSLSNMKTPYKMIAVFDYPEKKMYENKKILYLEHIQDPANLGTLIRSAVAFGFLNILLSKKSVNPYSEKVIRASSGYIFDCYIAKKDIDFSDYKRKGYKIVGAFPDKSTSKNEKTDFNDKIILVLGNEGHGISDEVLKSIDQNIKIRMDKRVESLNVAIAGSIIMHKFYKD